METVVGIVLKLVYLWTKSSLFLDWHPPGAYTALLAGLNNGIGVGLVEVYDRGGP
jgi:hypothetical protein